MKIEVVTMMYNEEFLAPFFLSNYSWADSITVLYDTDSTDKTREIMSSSNKVTIIDFSFPNGMDDNIKVAGINEYIRSSSADWIVLVDADEFVFRPKGNIREFLSRRKEDIVQVGFWEVYRHRDDLDLNANESPVVLQRRHGDPRFGQSYGTDWFIKPIVVRPKLEPQFGVGNHFLCCTGEFCSHSEEILQGAHWCMADPCFVVERRVKNRRERMSVENIRGGLVSQHWEITEEEILKECKEHLDDPIVIYMLGEQ